jgi:two-component system NarL family sensor kinase
MHNSSVQGIIIFIAGVSLLLAGLISFIVTIVYKYQQKQNAYYKDIAEIKTKYENALLKSQIEIQEQTFQNISREIHDNIGQKLTLVKLQLSTIHPSSESSFIQKANDSANMIGEAINDLSDISRSMSSELILHNGLIRALEFETTQFMKSGLYSVGLCVTGNGAFLDTHTELVIFRIVQEALNNIVKHAAATEINIHLDYKEDQLNLDIGDNGKGFILENNHKPGTGLANMKKRADLLNGEFMISSRPGKGTIIKIMIPIHEQDGPA